MSYSVIPNPVSAPQFGESIYPHTLVSFPLWYETTCFAAVDRLHMVAMFCNKDLLRRPIDFAQHTFQMWSLPSFVSRPTLPVKILAEPQGRVELGETFSYDLQIDVSGLPAIDSRLAFRVVGRSSGIVLPDRLQFISAAFAGV